MHKKEFFPLYCVHISRFHSAVTSNRKSFSPAATLDPRPRLWTRDRDFGPATRDPRLLVKLCLNQPFIIFIHHIWGETVLFIIQSSDRMRYFTIFQDKLHSVNIQDDPNRSKISENFQNHPYGLAGSRLYSASCQCGRVFEWTLTELRFNIIANLLLLVVI